MRLINDNVQKLLRIKDSELVECKDEKEFYKLLKEKITLNLDRLFEEKELKKKSEYIADITYDINILKDILRKYINYEDIASKRNKMLGGYSRKLIWKEIKRITKYDIDKVTKFGEKNNWPLLVLTHKDGFPVKILQEGKEYWDNAIAWSKLKSPYNQNFIDVIESIKRYESRIK